MMGLVSAHRAKHTMNMILYEYNSWSYARVKYGWIRMSF